MDETITGIFYIAPLYQLAYNILILFYRLLGNDLGLAIIGFTLALRALTLPFTFKQMANAKKSKEFQKKYKELQSKHKGDKEKLAEELTKLQAEYLPAQLGGCLPLILQIVFFFQIYYVVRNAVEVGAASFNRVNYSFISEFPADKLFDIDFFGINLGKSASDIGFNNWEAVAPYLVLVGLVGLTQFIASKVSLQLTGADLTPEEKAEKAKKDTTKEEEYSFAEAMQQSSRQMVYFLPIMTMFFSVNFPAGLSLYWAVSSGFALIQQVLIKRQQALKLIRKFLGRSVDNVEEAKIVKEDPAAVKAIANADTATNAAAKKDKKKKKKKKRKK